MDFRQEKDIEKILKQQDEMMKKYGYYVHLVPQRVVGCMDIHTHGVAESFGHRELEMSLAIPQQIAMRMLHDLVHKIKQGQTFEDGMESNEVIQNFPVRFKQMGENIRIIFPDDKGRFPDDIGCILPYSCQDTITFDD